MHEGVPDLLEGVVVQVQPGQRRYGGEGGKLHQPVARQLDLGQLRHVLERVPVYDGDEVVVQVQRLQVPHSCESLSFRS